MPKTRSRLAIEIFKNISDYYIETIPPSEIDKFVETGKKFYRLNRLEAQAMAKVINKLKPDVAYVDASNHSKISDDALATVVLGEVLGERIELPETGNSPLIYILIGIS